jgi:hypothetical protein
MSVDTGVVTTDLAHTIETPVRDGPALVTITRGSSTWTIDEDFAGWGLSTFTDDALIFTTVTTDGLQLGDP